MLDITCCILVSFVGNFNAFSEDLFIYYNMRKRNRNCYVLLLLSVNTFAVVVIGTSIRNSTGNPLDCHTRAHFSAVSAEAHRSDRDRDKETEAVSQFHSSGLLWDGCSIANASEERTFWIGQCNGCPK